MTARWGTYGGSPAFAWGQALEFSGGDHSAINVESNSCAPDGKAMNCGDLHLSVLIYFLREMRRRR
jgi:hypothetical protein